MPEHQEYGEYLRESRSRERQSARDSAVRDAVKRGHQAVVEGQYDEVADITMRLANALLPTVTVGVLRDCAREADADSPFDARAVLNVHHGNVNVTQACREPNGPAADTIEAAFESITTLATTRGLIEQSVTRRGNAKGFAVKLGEHLQNAEMDFGDEVEAVTTELGALKSFFTGGTSGGKSSGASRQFEDYYRESLSEYGRDIKCIDPAGLSAENIAAYDLPQAQNDLRHVRDNQDLPEDYTAIDDYDPDAEFYVPFTSGLDDFPVPHDVETGQPVVKRFTVPASHMSEELLVAVVQARVSPKEESIIREAYQTVSREHDDWPLAKLADEIRGRDELSEGNKKSAIRVLTNLQSTGYIRTADDEHCLDWEELFNSTDIITAFNQTPCTSGLHRLIIIAYLLEQIWERRIRSNTDQPHMAMWLRELWELVPNQYMRRARPVTEQAVLKRISNVLSKVMRKLRDINVLLVADTQEPNDVEKNIRRRFNRYVLFGGTNDDTLKDIFSWAGQSNWKSCKHSLINRPGHAAVIKGCAPAIKRGNWWGMGPVHLVPPSWNHHDKDKGPSGWSKREDISQAFDETRDEELQLVHWDTSLPEDLKIDGADTKGDDGPDVAMSPVAAFVDECLVYDPDEWVHKEDIRQAFNEFLLSNNRDPWAFDAEGGSSDWRKKFGNRINDAVKRVWGEEINGKKRMGSHAYTRVKFSPKGEQFFKDSQAMEPESAASTIRSDDD